MSTIPSPTVPFAHPGWWARATTRPVLSSELLVSLVCAYFVLCSNRPLWAAVHAAGVGPGVAVAFGMAVFGLHAALVGAVAWRAGTRPVLAALLVATAVADWFAMRYATVFDMEMIRSVLETDTAEAREFLSPVLVAHVVATGVLPALLVCRVRLRPRPLRKDLARRGAFLAAMIALSAASIGIASQGIFALIRADRALRYRITPGNYLVSLARVLDAPARPRDGRRVPIAADAHRAVDPAARRARLLVLVVGETIRGDHWGLNGYARQTTPLLAARPLVNFPDVTACGTSTAVSLPCMFSVSGRARYDAEAIARQETLLDVVQRVGVEVEWRDNQSGCKGICDRIPGGAVRPPRLPGACDGDRCLDEVLLAGLEQRIAAAHGDMLLVLHPLGVHGPDYSRRYPAAFERFVPACHRETLEGCSVDAIVNAYDNGILYTDAVLDRLLEVLERQRSHDAAMLFVSDHGESLGEYGLYLHGAPRAIAPRHQLHVPMTLWMSPGFEEGLQLDGGCLRRGADVPRSHDDLFHTVLGVFDIATADYRPEHDVLRSCRGSHPGAD